MEDFVEFSAKLKAERIIFGRNVPVDELFFVHRLGYWIVKICKRICFVEKKALKWKSGMWKIT